MAEAGAPGPCADGDRLTVNDFMGIGKARRNSIFSAVRDLNATAFPDHHYKNHLLDEVRKWKWITQNALEISPSIPTSSTPNTSAIQDTSVVSKMKSFIDEKPDLEAFMANNAKFVSRASLHCSKISEIHGRLNTFSEEKDQMVMEISRDVRDQILLDC